MLYLLLMSSSKVLTISLLQIQWSTAFTPGAVLLAASLLLLGVHNFQTLGLLLWGTQERIPPLFNLALLASFNQCITPILPSSANILSSFYSLLYSSLSLSLSLCTFPTFLCFWLFFFTFSSLSLSPNSLRVFQWNTKGFQVKSAKLLHFHPVDLICIQKSNLNLSSFFWILRYSTLRSDCTHYRSHVLSPDDRTPAAAPSFSSGGDYPFLNFLLSLFFFFISTLIM